MFRSLARSTLFTARSVVIELNARPPARVAVGAGAGAEERLASENVPTVSQSVSRSVAELAGFQVLINGQAKRKARFCRRRRLLDLLI